MTRPARLFPVLVLLALAACGSGGPGLEGLDVTPPPDLVDAGDPGHPDVTPFDPGTPDATPGDAMDVPGDLPPADVGPDVPKVPVIAVDPNPLDLGFGPQGLPVQRTVTVRNDGTGPLVVDEVVLPQDSGGEFKVDASGVLAGPLHAKDSATLTVTFTNAGAASGSAQGLLRIRSNDPANPKVDVALSVQRSGPPTCTFELVPSELNLGTVPVGFPKEMAVNLVNTGTGSLLLEDLVVYGCAKGTGGVTCGQAMGFSPWWDVQVAEGQSAVVPPGSSVGLRLRLAVPAGETGIDGVLPGRLFVRYACPYGAPEPDSHTWPADCAPSAACPPNLGATLAVPLLRADPVEVSFADTRSGCQAPFVRVRITNPGSSEATVSSIEIDPACGNRSSFLLKGVPSTPLVLGAGKSLDVEVAYRPDGIGTASCNLLVNVSDPEASLLVVPLIGTSTSDGTVVDRSVQAARKSDILFVIDASGSMQDGTLDRLVASVPALVEALATAGSSPHVGIVGIGTDPTCPTAANLAGKPRVMDGDTIGTFTTTITALLADTLCDASAAETGLEAARLALSSPRVDDAGTTCVTDLGCDPPYHCVEGGCGGANRAFLRADAALDVIVVTDEDDQSASATSTYTAFLRNFKGPGGEALSRLHAIAGDVPGGCDNTWHYAGAGTRYAEVAKATGGSFASLCQASYEPALAAIGAIPYVARTAFPLSASPAGRKVVVTVDGTPCDSGWALSGDQATVEFDTGSPCFPAPGATVEIRYSVACK